MYHSNATTTAEETAEHAPARFAPPAGAATDSGDHRLVIESRFGTLALAPHSALEFPRGLLGFSDLHAYALADLGDPRLPQFKVLQSLDDHGLSFLVLPLDPASGLIAQHDLAEACAALSIAERDVAILLVVTVHRTADGVLVSANLRAPLLIDTTSRIGVQHVLPNDSYPVRLALTEQAS